MHILEYEDYKVKPTEECFMIKPFRILYLKDKTKEKENFMLQIAIAYFMVDPRSSYSYITDDNERYAEILKQEGLPADYKISNELKEAMEIYKKHIITTSYLLLQDTKACIDNVRKFLRTVDLSLLDDKGKPVYTVNTITSALKEVPKLSKELMDVERTITKEIEEEGRARGITEKKVFEDGI